MENFLCLRYNKNDVSVAGYFSDFRKGKHQNNPQSTGGLQPTEGHGNGCRCCFLSVFYCVGKHFAMQ